MVHLSPRDPNGTRSSIRLQWPTQETRQAVKKLRGTSNPSFQRSGTTNFRTRSARRPIQTLQVSRSCFEPQAYDSLAHRGLCDARGQEFSQDSFSNKLHAEARTRHPSFSRFRRTGEKGRAVPEKGNNLRAGRSRQECVVHPKGRREALRYEPSWQGSGGGGFGTG